MSQDPQPLPLDAGTHFPGVLDHAWVVEGLDQHSSGALLCSGRRPGDDVDTAGSLRPLWRRRAAPGR